MSHFGIKKVVTFLFFIFFRVTTMTGSDIFLPAYSQLNKINQSINPCNLNGGRYTSSSLRLYYSNDSFLWLIKSPLQRIFLKLFFSYFGSLTENLKTTFVRKKPKVTFFFFFFWSLTGFFFQKKLVRQVIKLEWP